MDGKQTIHHLFILITRSFVAFCWRHYPWRMIIWHWACLYC